MIDYIGKPVRAGLLREMVEKYISGQRSATDSSRSCSQASWGSPGSRGSGDKPVLDSTDINVNVNL